MSPPTGENSPIGGPETASIVKHSPADDASTAAGSNRSAIRWSSLLILLLMTGLMVRHLLPATIGETARRQLLSRLREHYGPDWVVTIGRGTFDPHRGLIFEDFRIGILERPPNPATESATAQLRRWVRPRIRDVVRCNELVAEGDFDRHRALSGDNPIRSQSMSARGITIDVWFDREGQLPLRTAMRLPRMGPVTPTIKITDATVRVHRNHQGEPPKDRVDTAVATLDVAAATIQSIVRADGAVHRIITAGGGGDWLDQWKVIAECDDAQNDIRLAATGVRIEGSRLIELPIPIPKFHDRVKPLTSLSVSSDWTASVLMREGEIRHDIRTQINDARFDHPALPMPIEHANGQIRIVDSVAHLTQTTLRLGDSNVRVSGTIDPSRSDEPVDLDIAVENLKIDRERVAKLPVKFRGMWEKMRPVGVFGGSIKLQIPSTRAAAIPTPLGPASVNGTIRFRDVSVSPAKFPFPVSNLSGDVGIHDGRVRCEMSRGRLGPGKIIASFDIPLRPDPGAQRVVHLASDGPLAINETLIAAMTPRSTMPETSSGSSSSLFASSMSPLERFVRSLHPRGSVRLESATFAVDPDGTVHRSMSLDFEDAAMRYELFPYPLRGIRGGIVVRDHDVAIEGLVGTTDGGGRITCNGSYRIASPSSDADLSLRFDAEQLALDGRLRDALPPSTRSVWREIQPAGVLDRAAVRLNRRGDQPIALQVAAAHVAEPATSSSDGAPVDRHRLSIRPRSFAYPLDITEASVSYDGDRVRIDRLLGVNDRSRLSARGQCFPTPEGRWVLSLDLLSGSRLHPEAELIDAMPESMRRAMQTVALRGPVNVRGHGDLTLPNPTIDGINAGASADWNLIAQLEGNRIGEVSPVRAIRGEIAVVGHRDDATFDAAGRVAIDSMHVFDLQVTSFTGPFRVEGDTLSLGKSSNDNPESIVGQLMGGELAFDGDLTISDGEYDVTLTLKDASMPRVMREFSQNDQGLTGVVTVQSQLQGNLASVDLLRGSGAARVSGTNVYELPMLVQIFNQLRISPTPKNAFTDGQVSFSLFGEHLTFSDVNVWGDLVSVQGGGTMNSRRELDLTFNTRVSPQNPFSRAIGPLRDTRYALFTVDITGPLNNPKIQRRRMPGMSAALERWFPRAAKRRDASIR